jgi:hypothetical protein
MQLKDNKAAAYADGFQAVDKGQSALLAPQAHC